MEGQPIAQPVAGPACYGERMAFRHARRVLPWVAGAAIAAVMVAFEIHRATASRARTLHPARGGAISAAPPGGAPMRRALAHDLSPGSLRFAVIGDPGRGDALQIETAAELTRWRDLFDFSFVLMLGDNIYPSGAPTDFIDRFEQPYTALLGDGVTFYAVRGDHDPPGIFTYPPFHMNGQRYYTFTERTGLLAGRREVQFFALDTAQIDAGEREWLARTLAASTADWRIAFYHHPLYTSGRYRVRAMRTRAALESLFLAHHVQVGFSGHEHVYERIVPEHGVQYFTSGAAGALRPGDVRPSRLTAAYFDRDTHFMLVEITSELLRYQVISRTGETVDVGDVKRK